jgi:drug/metabolite transporter (DMT)-like permease
MLYLILCIACSSVLYIIFKKFEQYGIDLLQAIVVNYLVAGSLGFVLANYSYPSSINFVIQEDWSPIVILLGLMFVSIFNLLGISSQKAGVSVTSVANKLSVVLPVLFGFIFLNETTNTGKIAGIFLALVALYLTTHRPSSPGKKTSLLFPVLIFFSSGALDILLSFCERNYVTQGLSIAFTGLIFTMAAAFGLLMLVIGIIRGKQQIRLKNIIGGIVLGLPNFFSILFIFIGLKETKWPVTTFFPVCNMGVMVFTTLLGYFLLREKISWVNLAGIVLALTAIIMISFADLFA